MKNMYNTDLMKCAKRQKIEVIVPNCIGWVEYQQGKLYIYTYFSTSLTQ